MKINIRKTGVTDKAQIEVALAAEGYSVYDWRDFPGASYPVHVHRSDEARWVVRGGMTLGVGGEEFTLEPGDVIYLPANTPHWAKTEKGVAYICGTR